MADAFERIDDEDAFSDDDGYRPVPDPPDIRAEVYAAERAVEDSLGRLSSASDPTEVQAAAETYKQARSRLSNAVKARGFFRAGASATQGGKAGG